MNFRFFNKIFHLFIFVFLILFQAARAEEKRAADCNKQFLKGKEWPASYVKNIMNYCEAIQDSKIAEPQEIKPLRSIVPWNKNIIWNQTKSRVLLVSWVPDWAVEKFYRPQLGSFYQTPRMESIYIWVTLVPDMRGEIKRILKLEDKRNEINLSIRKILGLPPQEPSIKEKRFFVEMWVRPKDLFRPCLDPEVVDNSCLLDPIENKYKKFGEMASYVKLSEDHKNWFKAKKEKSYKGGNPFPWTRLGYTYRWGSEDKVGLSEFVIKQGSDILIHKIIESKKYK